MLAKVIASQPSVTLRAYALSTLRPLQLHNSPVRKYCCGDNPVTSFSSGCSRKPSVFPSEKYSFTFDTSKVPQLPEIAPDLIQLLEEQSLVRFSDEAAVRHLQMAISYANVLQLVNTDGVQPMHTVLEDESLFLQADVDETTRSQEILANARKTAEGYFVAPPGNVPLGARNDPLDFKEIKRLMKAKF